ncbi:Stp1/IreP family PP2C-type Ser/Thr phosphatase [Vaginisenegalia massiliensis]|uniref:Stp1/IreP family PP2C-type Ser/Thr phosphatase n=1 Tax=Vaginisenegalia massiliensis TaxID=2058294 RepID=UPI000F51C364|nr:Stp1/IreP family PP2C-type Ser/Thr phosphatase [Vaginisenegalia massiliensis]
MKIKIHSSIGKRRTTNQDYADYFTNQFQQTIFVLCDGVGGHQAGDVASKLTTEFIGQKFTSLTEAMTAETLQNWLNQTIVEVNHFIYEKSLEKASLEGMGTTLVVAIKVDNQVLIGHVGDSRAYVYHDGHLRQITEDHSLVNELIKTGEITPEEGVNHPRRNVVTRSIGGTDEVEAEFNWISLDQIEILMLCSDGLTNMVSEEDLIQYFAQSRKQGDFGQLLIDAANEAGGADNITVVLVTDLTLDEIEEVAE